MRTPALIVAAATLLAAAAPALAQAAILAWDAPLMVLAPAGVFALVLRRVRQRSITEDAAPPRGGPVQAAALAPG